MESIEQLSFIVVEDNEFQRTVAMKIIEAMGSRYVLGAEDGQDALEKLVAAPNPIDIVISDLDMPGMDGVEFMRHLAEQKLCGAVVVASGMDAALIHTVEDLVREHGLFVIGHIKKPMTGEKVQDMLDIYFAKQNQCNSDIHAHKITLADIENALAEDQLKTWYQPKIKLKDGRWCSVEALARWESPQHGLIQPGRFIPVMEENGLIEDLTWQQIHHVILDLKQWLKQGRKITASVNISPPVLDDILLPEKLTEIISYHKVPPESIMLEITESVVIKNITRSLDTIARLKLKGFALSIDDFGTGYSSLQQLSRIPFSELKIDQTFVRGLVKNETGRAIVEANIELASKLGLSTVAEGVETLEEWKLLRQMKCDVAQGYFISEAIPASQLDAWHKQWVSTQDTVVS